MRHRALSSLVLALGLGLLTVLLIETSAEAQRGLGGAGRPVRLEGYWDRTRADPEVIGTLVVSPDGTRKRTLGLTAAMAYQPPEEGTQIFRGSTIQPIALLLRGRSEMVARFMDAKPTERIVAFGLYTAGAAQLVLSSVELKTMPPPEPSD